MYRTASQFFGFYPKFIQGKKSHKNQTEKFKTKLRKIRQNPRKTLDIFALCSNKIQSQNYTFVIPLFLLIQKLYEKSAVSHAHRRLKKYTIFNYLSLLIRISLLGLNYTRRKLQKFAAKHLLLKRFSNRKKSGILCEIYQNTRTGPCVSTKAGLKNA